MSDKPKPTIEEIAKGWADFKGPIKFKPSRPLGPKKGDVYLRDGEMYMFDGENHIKVEGGADKNDLNIPIEFQRSEFETDQEFRLRIRKHIVFLEDKLGLSPEKDPHDPNFMSELKKT